jgi:hypothetical protein
MPASPGIRNVARFASILSLGLGLLVVAGCGPPEAGSIKPPADFKRPGHTGYGPGVSQGAPPAPTPGQFGPAPARAKTKALGGRPIRSKK